MEKSDSLLNTLEALSNRKKHDQKHFTQKFSFQDRYQIADRQQLLSKICIFDHIMAS